MQRMIAATAVAVLVMSGCATPTGHEGHGTQASGSAGPHDRFDHQMHAMSETHRKMMATKTPEERRAMMSEHMKAMQGGMRMMCEMGSGTAPEAAQRCSKMREMTEKMMIEREGKDRGP